MLVVFILGFLYSICQCKDRPVVNCPLGKIVGNYRTSFGSRTFSAFEGIPYAKPPTGEKRFKEPEPIEKWTEPLDASSLFECPQIQPFTKEIKISGTEDCLYINVYVPRDCPSPSEDLDVVVHIHGGGFMFGSGHGYAHPSYLMDRDIVFVTFNYRLGIFGFLSTEDNALPGNNGLKDQVLALKWVRNNIASFGGNPNSVTLNGASAGGTSVHLHYFSPKSKGFFNRGWSTSGCALNPFAIVRTSLEKAKRLAVALECPDTPSGELVECLKQKDYRDILNKSTLFYGYKTYPVCLFGPVIEKPSSGAFLTDEPKKLLERGQVEDLPWIASFVPKEAGSLFPDFRSSIKELDPIWTEVAPVLLYFNDTIPKDRWKEVAEKIRKFYFGDEVLGDDNVEKFYKLATDRLIVAGVSQAVELQAAVTKSPVYLYELSYTGDYKKTVEHADDNQYFFNDQYDRKPTEHELKVKELMVNMFVSFSKTSKPAIKGVQWEPVKGHQFKFLNISGSRPEDLKVETFKNPSDNNFWESLGLLTYN